MHLQVVQIVTFIIAFSIAATRVLTASKAFWSFLPDGLAAVLPSLIVAIPALGEAVVGAQSWTDLSVAFLTAGALLLPGAHSHTLQITKPNGPGSRLVGMAMCFMLSALMFTLLIAGCAAVGSTFTWPTAVACLPTTTTLKSQVEAILLAGGDYEAALKQLALSDGAAAVECAVEAFAKSFAPADDAAGGAARARGRAFLDAHSVKVAQ